MTADYEPCLGCQPSLKLPLPIIFCPIKSNQNIMKFILHFMVHENATLFGYQNISETICGSFFGWVLGEDAYFGMTKGV